MPRYLAKANLFVGGSRIRAGETFESNDKPGKQWELVGAAKAAERKPEPVQRELTPPTRVQQPATTAPKDPFEGWDEDQLRNFIATKGGKTPGRDASPATLLARARALLPSDGDG